MNKEPVQQEQVWQRVLAPQGQSPREGLRGLILTAAELAAAYRQLAGSINSKGKELLQSLYQGELSNVASLKGISLLSGGTEEGLRSWNPEKAPARRRLEKCYHQTRRCLTEYLSRSAHTEFGEVYRQLYDRECRHCLWITEVLGNL